MYAPSKFMTERIFVCGSEEGTMETGRARILLRVEDIEASLSFYMKRLGWGFVERADAGEAAYLRIAGTQDEAVLLASGSDVSITSRWLQPNHTSPRAGGLVYIGVDSVAHIEERLRANGCHADLLRREEPGHIRELYVITVDGYTLVYWEELFPSDAEILHMFETGVSELERAITELSEAQLSLTEHPGKWSIREHVLHVVDLELVTMHKVKFALAESGRMYQGNSFQPDDWHRGLAYVERPLTNDIQLFQAARRHILGLCRHLPDALKRTVRTRVGKRPLHNY